MFDQDGEDAATYALGRRPWRTYFSRSFPLGLPASRDSGHWARYAYKVFDEPTVWIERDDSSGDLEWTEELMRVSPRKQLKFQIARAAGEIRQIDIEQVRTAGGKPELQRILRLDREGARRLVELIETLKHVPVEGEQQTVRIDDETLREFFADPAAMVRLYERDPQRFRELIRSDASAEDVVALAHRKEVVQRFRQLLAETGEATWLIRPRSFLIIGDLEELRGPAGVHPDKHQSFELYRRNLYETEIITFDELLARAEWHVEVAEQEESSDDRW